MDANTWIRVWDRPEQAAVGMPYVYSIYVYMDTYASKIVCVRVCACKTVLHI